MKRLAPVLVLALAACAGPSRWGGAVPPEKQVVVVSLDGGGEQILERLMGEGAMPHMQAYARRGTAADYSRTHFPSKTAAGHATLWTGAFGDVHGITSNNLFLLPTPEHTALETERAFASTALLAEPLWVTAARQGKRVDVLQATHVTPFSPYQPGGRFGGQDGGRLTISDGYAGETMPQRALTTFTWKPVSPSWRESLPASDVAPRWSFSEPGAAGFAVVAYGDPATPSPGYDTLAFYGAPEEAAPLATLRPGLGNWATLERPVGPGGRAWPADFMAYRLAPDLSAVGLYRSGFARQLTWPAERASLAGWIGGGGVEEWHAGAFGPICLDTGAFGDAERIYLETVRHSLADARARRARALAAGDADLVIQYIKFPDELLHHIYGACDPELPGLDPRKRDASWKFLSELGTALDASLSDLLDDPRRNVAIVSDHGMAGLRAEVHVNEILKRAGLLALTPEGRIDLARTRVLYPPTDGTYLVVNRRSRFKGGVVEDADAPAALAAARKALEAARDASGKALVTAFITPESRKDPLGLGGVRGGDLYLDLAPGYYFTPALARDGALTSPLPFGTGGHIFDPRRPSMHAVAMWAGPRIREGGVVSAVTNRDLAPTVCRLLGIAPSPESTGRVETEILRP